MRRFFVIILILGLELVWSHGKQTTLLPEYSDKASVINLLELTPYQHINSIKHSDELVSLRNQIIKDTFKLEQTSDTADIVQQSVPFTQDQKFITSEVTQDEINAWICKRIAHSENNAPEIVQFPVKVVESICGHACSLYKIPNVPRVGNKDTETIWINLDINEYTDVNLRYITGYFTGEKESYFSPDQENEYSAYNFHVLRISRKEEQFYDDRGASSYFIYPKIISKQLYTDLQVIRNIEMILFDVLYNGNKYKRIFPNLPKAQQALVHQDSQIEVIFKGQTLPPAVTISQLVEVMKEDAKAYKNVINKYNPKENWYFFQGQLPHTETYLIFKKWMIENGTSTFTIEMKVEKDQLETAHEILSDFDPQVVPEINYP